MNDHLLGIDDAAKTLGLSPWTVRRLIDRGKLKRVKIGRRVLLKTTEIQRFVESCVKADLENSSMRAL